MRLTRMQWTQTPSPLPLCIRPINSDPIRQKEHLNTHIFCSARVRPCARNDTIGASSYLLVGITNALRLLNYNYLLSYLG